MTVTSLPQAQAAIFARLTGNASFMTTVKGVFDTVPDAQKYPYVVIGDATEAPDRTMGQNGHEVMAFISVYTQDGVRSTSTPSCGGYAPGLAIAGAAIELLVDEDDPMTVDGHDVVDVSVESIDTNRTKDNREIIAQIRLWLEDSL